jgi:beta-fructofuranosidase
MSLPRKLDLSPQGTLVSQPVPELESLRSTHWQVGQARLAPAAEGPRIEPRSEALEILALFDGAAAALVGVRLHWDGIGPPLSILSDARNGTLLLSWADERRESRRVTGLPWAPGVRRLRVFVDHGVVEAFDDHASITEIFEGPNLAVSRIEAFAVEQEARMLELDVWAMRSIWEPLDSSSPKR